MTQTIDVASPTKHVRLFGHGDVYARTIASCCVSHWPGIWNSENLSPSVRTAWVHHDAVAFALRVVISVISRDGRENMASSPSENGFNSEKNAQWLGSPLKKKHLPVLWLNNVETARLNPAARWTWTFCERVISDRLECVAQDRLDKALIIE